MNFPRRRFLGSSFFMFGSTLMDALTTPLWQWRDPTLVKAATSNPVPSPVQFVDVAEQAGLKIPNVWGAADHKRYIIEAKGSGLAFFDYDHDGWLDIYLTNGTHLDANWPPGKAPTSHLYKNNRDGTFTDVSEKSGILKPGPRYSITAVAYDFDNDGWPDIYVAVDSEPSILYHNNHDGTFTDVAVMAGCAYNEDGQEQAGMGVGVGDYDCDGNFDIFKTNFSDDTSDLYHNNGDGTFTDATFVSGVGVNTQYVGWGCGFVDYDND